MKPTYDECTCKWRVKGLGLFESSTEAWRAIRLHEKTKMVSLLISPKMLNDLRTQADTRKISVSELIRQAIEKEVNSNGN